MDNLAIRRCLPDDAEALSVLASRTFYDAFIHSCSEADMHYFLDLHYEPESLRQELYAGKLQTWLAFDGDRPVGFLSIAQRQPPFPHDKKKAMELVRLYVLKKYHGKGVASLLMRHYLDESRKANASFLWLGVWERNERAKAFYKKWNFKPTGYTHPFTIGLALQTDEWWSLAND